MFRVSLRSWSVLALPVVGVLLLAYCEGTPEPPVASAERVRDSALPGGGTATLSKCGLDDGPRPAPRGEGERGTDPQLVLTGWGYFDPGPKEKGEPSFTVHAAIRTGDRPLVLSAPPAAHRITVDVFGPHGEGRRASARGLTATVVDGGYPSKPARIPETGSFRIDPGEELYLDIPLPAGAVCPGQSLVSINRCSPEQTNDAFDCPVLTLTLADPAISAYRAAAAGAGSAGEPSDRLVAVSLEPNTSEV
ncbi:hypothetical protein [Streptomyces sp. NPDC003832]